MELNNEFLTVNPYILYPMKRLNLKLAIVQIRKLKSFSMINLGGLAILLSAGIVILVYASYEMSFDRHIPDYNNKYRLITALGEGRYWSRSFACYPEALSGSPEIANMTSFIQTNNNIVKIGDSEITVSEAVIADTAFPDFFGIEFISGRKEDIGIPNSVTLTSDLAEKLFPGENAYGRTLFLDQIEGNNNDSLGLFTITGIVKPFPENSHFGFQMIFSQTGNLGGLVNHLRQNKIFSSGVYIQINEPDNINKVESRLKEVLVPYLSNSFGPPTDAFNTRLQAVGDIHFTTDLNREPRPVIRRSVLYLLFSIGGLILILMSANLVSMAIVQSIKQRKETGIMRALGAGKYDLFRLSLARVSLLVGTSVVLSFLIILFSGNRLDQLFESNWDPGALIGEIILYSLTAGIIVSFLVASAMHLSNSSRSPVSLLSGEWSSGRSLFRVLGALITVQFGIVIFLLGFSLMIGKQLNYMDNKSLGYNPENILLVRIPGQNPRGSLLLEEVRKHHSTLAASTVHHHPGDVFQHLDFQAGQEQYPFEFRMVDRDVFETLDISLLKRFVPEDRNLEGWVINETFYNSLLQHYSEEDIAASNFTIPEEQPEDPSRERFMIAGVMSDFHYSSLHDQIGNFAFVMRDPAALYNRWLMVRFSEGGYRDCRSAVTGIMNTHFPGRPVNSFLLSENLDNRYASSRKLSAIVLIFTLISVLLAGLGLYGLASYTAQERTKEIGIRKVFGAATGRVLGMLHVKFLKLVAISFCIACPVTILAVRKWLMNFAYKTTPSVWVFLLVGFLVVTIATVSITRQSLRASRMNPVDAIRYE